MAPSSEIIEISDSDNDDAPPLPPPSSSQPSFNGDLVDLCLSDNDDDDELPAPGDALFFQGLNATGKRKRHSVASSMSSAMGYDGHELDSSENESPKKAPRKSSGTKAARKPRKTEEEKAAAKAQKQKDAADKKAMKAAEKAEKAAALAREKAAKQAYKAANKLIHDKKTTLASMEIVFPPSLANSDLIASFRAHIAPYKMTVSVAPTNLVRRQSVFTWRRTMSAEYDPVMREWQPVQEHTQTIDTYMMYMGADELVRCISEDSEDGLKNAVRLAREGCGSPKAQMFLMVEGLKLYYRRTGGIRYTKTQIELALAGLQLAENTHLLYVDTVNDAVERLYDLSADLGIKPYKLIERSHLPFCSNVSQPTGTSLADTWVKMLGQVHRMTESGARGIAEDFPTAHKLFEGYQRAEDGRARDALVMYSKIRHRKDGVAKERIVNQALSQVVGTVMYGLDPLQLVYSASKKGEREDE